MAWKRETKNWQLFKGPREVNTLECCGRQRRGTRPPLRGSRELAGVVVVTTELSPPGAGKDQTKQRVQSAKTQEEVQGGTGEHRE